MRLQRLRKALQHEGLDAFLVSIPENRRYISGFTGSAGHLFITQKDAVLATDFRYTEQAGKQSPGFRVMQATDDLSWFAHLLDESGAQRIGIESDFVTLSAYEKLVGQVRKLSSDPKHSLVATEGIVSHLRMVKDTDELALMQRAADIADNVLAAVAPTIQAGQTEQQVAWKLEKHMRELGAESVSFEIIVGSGPNGAMPHHRASDTPIKSTEPIVIDMGARYDGYCSDLTRTLFVGKPSEQFRKVYDTVLGAQLTAMSLIRPGMTGEQADALAREVITKAGYGEQFGHSLGHGVGLAVHEMPRVGPKSTHVLEEGMVFSVEPGVYLPGQGGVRIEDMVVLEKNGIRSLSHAAKTL
jgi:Xaa-Pro aminopeptidase